VIPKNQLLSQLILQLAFRLSPPDSYIYSYIMRMTIVQVNNSPVTVRTSLNGVFTAVPQHSRFLTVTSASEKTIGTEELKVENLNLRYEKEKTLSRLICQPISRENATIVKNLLNVFHLPKLDRHYYFNIF
jgi:hypothetical protein